VYNCTVRVAIEPPDNVFLWILVEGDDEAVRHRIPYTLLAEWRDMSEA
jgi:hypothetical protein